jgi:hypothetical protein
MVVSESTRAIRSRRSAARVFSIAAIGLVALAGCGSSKPSYCTDRSNLESSIKGLSNFNVSSGVSGLKSEASKIQSQATALVNSAKSDFPSETSAIKSSVSALESAVKGLSSSPSSAQIAAVATAGSSVVNSVTSFMNASSSKCS